jgi:hypothetical protein
VPSSGSGARRSARARDNEIADRLNITEGTVRIYLHNIYEKIDVEGRVALTVWAKDRGFLRETGKWKREKKEEGTGACPTDLHYSRFA